MSEGVNTRAPRPYFCIPCPCLRVTRTMSLSGECAQYKRESLSEERERCVAISSSCDVSDSARAFCGGVCERESGWWRWMRERRRAIVCTRALSASRGSRACVDARESRVREFYEWPAESFSGLLTEISASAISVRTIALPMPS